MITNRTLQEIIWITLKKFQKLLRRLALLKFLIRVQAFWDPLCGELPHVQIVMNDKTQPTHVRCPVAQLLI